MTPPKAKFGVFECTCGAIRLEINAEIREGAVASMLDWIRSTMLVGMNLVCGCTTIKD